MAPELCFQLLKSSKFVLGLIVDRIDRFVNFEIRPPDDVRIVFLDRMTEVTFSAHAQCHQRLERDVNRCMRQNGADLYTTQYPNLMFRKKYEYLNTTRNPMHYGRGRISVWPFMNSTLQFCNSISEVDQIKNKILELNFSPKYMNTCRRPCFFTDYSLARGNDITTQKGNANIRQTSVAVTMKSNLKHIVSEYFTYPFSTLISDVGGSIGLFLGISLLSCFKFLRKILNKMYHTFCPANK
uniref:Uncharacterized protein n=1 Tax=Strigamia maritima TaxID=126957 RepID=T1JIV8_STRMM